MREPDTAPHRDPVPEPAFRRYLGYYIAGTLLLVTAIGLWSALSLRHSQAIYSLYRYQLDKLAQAPGPVSTVFVGDSSLGNGIDTREFGELAHAPALNLALTASYGYAGSYDMLRRALVRFRVRNVVIMQTADMLKHAPDNLAYLMSADDPAVYLADWTALPAALDAGLEYLQMVYSVDSLKRSLRYTLQRPQPADIWKYDYVKQNAQLKVTPELIARETLKPGFDARKLDSLKRLAELCRAEGLNCVYAHGPLLEGICKTSRAYLEQATQAIRDAGLYVLPGTPLCIPASGVGDWIYHASPAFKAESTMSYYRLLAQSLK